ncbi:MAG: hypothetical protein HQL88_05460 [Magnetococcales bacterium]|nr:hypothetical protein [Magnetococcales bacterium]
MKKQDRIRQAGRADSGFVLVVFMVLLLILSLLAVHTMGTGISEQIMAGNNQFANKTFNNAEAGLVQGEHYIETTINTTFPDFQSSHSIAGATFNPFPGNNNITIQHLGGVVVVQTTGIVRTPACTAGATGCLDYYRVTSVGTGSGPSMQTVSSVYTKYINYIP